jgi:peptidoglycan/xylan/chitin deacetylase (PgdA/CDA1 family)
VTAHEPTAAILEARGVRGHFFIVTQRVGQPGFLTDAQIRDLHARGHNIGSHSHSHPTRFSALGYGDMLYEWFESRRILTEILGEPPYTASVPGGFHSTEVARAANEAGFRVLFNSEPTSRVHRVGDLAVLGRYGIKNGTPAELAQALVRGDFAPRMRQTVAWNAKKALKALGGSLWHEFRGWYYKRMSS